MRILVVEDDADVRDTLCAMLEAAGHEVTMAGNVPDAIAQLQSPRCDVVLTDLVLPGGNGRAVAAVAAALGIRAVLCSGHPEQIERLRREGIEHLVKPFSIARLEAALAAARLLP